MILTTAFLAWESMTKKNKVYKIDIQCQYYKTFFFVTDNGAK